MSVQDDLHEWLLERPLWQQELARRLLKQTDLERDSLNEVLEFVLDSIDEASKEDLLPLGIDEFPIQASGSAIRLCRVGSLKGVAAAAEDQTVEIEPHGLTIVYGANAAGKSTYVRVLKRVLRTVDTENVLRGDVYADSVSQREEATATLGLMRGEDRDQIPVDLHNPPELDLDTISVFDSACAEIYLDSRNAIAYVPLPIRLLSRMATAQDNLRSRIIELKDAELRNRPDFGDLPEGTSAAAHVESLDYMSDLDELSRFCSLSEQEKERLSELRAALASVGTRDLRADAEAARQDARDAARILELLQSMSEDLSEETLGVLREAAREARMAQEGLDAAAEALRGLNADIGGDAWRRMWEAARDFVTQHGKAFPLGVGEQCPLCLRVADSDTAARLNELEAHVHSRLQDQVTQSEQRLQELRETVDPGRADSVKELLSRSIADKDPALEREVERSLQLTVTALTSAHQDPESATGAADLHLPVGSLQAWQPQRHEHAETLERAVDPEGHAELEGEAAELEGRKLLSERFGEVTAWVNVLERVERLEAAYSALSTNRLTRKQRELSETVVSEILAESLEAELRALNCSHLPVNLDPRTAVGRTDVALRLAGAYEAPSVSDVLSEGEQRALALAFFLAEVSSAEHDGGIVLDDPVSSLDDERKAYIATRLIEECRQRQVIVFTHDLPFMLELGEKAEDGGIEVALRGMWRQSAKVGRVDEHPPFHALKLRQRVGRLTERVQEWDRGPDPEDEDEAWSRVCDFYAQMRVTWERAVEERLFRGVVQRFQREVKTQSLKDVDIRPELVEAVNEGMTRCSLFVHDAPPGTRSVIPARADLQADLEKLRTFEEATRLS